MRKNCILLFILWVLFCGATFPFLNKSERYFPKTYHAEFYKARMGPEMFHLAYTDPYLKWAAYLQLMDSSRYIMTGVGITEGKGVFTKCLNPAQCPPDGYAPYHMQGPGTPVIIAGVIKLFGAGSVLPYYILVLLVHYATAVGVMFLARQFSTENRVILLSGLLSIFCIPVFMGNSGIGLFLAEPYTALLGIGALNILATFLKPLCLKSSIEKVVPLKTFMLAVTLGVFLALASYFRDIYSSFFIFTLLALLGFGIFYRHRLIPIICFALVSLLTVTIMQYPWKLRNKTYTGFFTMASTSQDAYAMWESIWMDHRLTESWCRDCRFGWGDYLKPSLTPIISKEMIEHRKTGLTHARQALLEAIVKQPAKAALFRLSKYDTFWFGPRDEWWSYIFCIISFLSFFLYNWINRSALNLILWIFPAFCFVLSLIIHYEPRYAFPFYQWITPITLGYVLNHAWHRMKRSKTMSEHTVSTT